MKFVETQCFSRDRLNLVSVLGISVFSIILAVVAHGLSFPEKLSPRSHQQSFFGIAADGWILDGSKVTLPSVVPFASVVSLEFDHWRPGTDEPAHLIVSSCATGQKDILVLPNAEPLRMRLGAGCSFLRPIEIAFRVVNPVRAGEDDARQVAVRLQSVSLHSALGLPLLLEGEILISALLLMVLYVVVRRLCCQFSLVIGQGAAMVLPALFGLGAALLISNSQAHNRLEVWWLLGAVALIFAGAQRSVAPQHDSPVSVSTTRLLLLSVFLLGAGLRFYGLDFGLPDPYHPDELKKAQVLQSMSARDSLNPQYFLHPSLLLYSGYALANVLIGVFGHGALPETYILGGRLASALAGSLSILVLYCIGTRLHSRWLGFVAAALLSVSPLHVTCSRYMKEDALLLFFLLLTVACALRAVNIRSLSSVLLTGVSAGLAMGSKYSGLLAVGLLLALPWLVSRSVFPDRRMSGFVCGGMLLVPLVFLLTSPYALLDYPTFKAGLAYEAAHMLDGHTARIDPWSQYWMYHMRRSLVPGMQFLPLLFGVYGFGRALRSGSLLWLSLAGLVLLFYLPAEWVRAKPAPQPERYVLTCVPFIALLAGFVLVQVQRKAVQFALVVLLLFAPLYRSVTLASELRLDTRKQMALWIAENVPAGSKIAIDGGYYAPVLDDSLTLGSDTESEFQPPRFDIAHLHVATRPWEYRLARLERQGFDFIILSSLSYDRYFSQPLVPPSQRAIYQRLQDSAQLVKEFQPRFGTYGFHNPTLQLYAVSSQARAQFSPR